MAQAPQHNEDETETDTSLQTVFSNALSWMKTFNVISKFHRNGFLVVQLAARQHLFFWRRRDDKPIHEKMLLKFCDTIWRHWARVSLWLGQCSRENSTSCKSNNCAQACHSHKSPTRVNKKTDCSVQKPFYCSCYDLGVWLSMGHNFIECHV